MELFRSVSKFPGLVIGFHGCDKKVADRVLSGKEDLCDSNKPYDWLGPGKYFWEDSYQRALDWAVEHSKGKEAIIRTPAVIGAIIDMGLCLNLVDTYSIRLVKATFDTLKADRDAAKLSMPENKNPKYSDSISDDKVLRYLDCAVIKYLCSVQREEFKTTINTVRGVFLEGKPLYKGAGFRDKTHIQICVRTKESIKGYFLPRI